MKAISNVTVLRHNGRGSYLGEDVNTSPSKRQQGEVAAVHIVLWWTKRVGVPHALISKTISTNPKIASFDHYPNLPSRHLLIRNVVAHLRKTSDQSRLSHLILPIIEFEETSVESCFESLKQVPEAAVFLRFDSPR